MSETFLDETKPISPGAKAKRVMRERLAEVGVRSFLIYATEAQVERLREFDKLLDWDLFSPAGQLRNGRFRKTQENLAAIIAFLTKSNTPKSKPKVASDETIDMFGEWHGGSGGLSAAGGVSGKEGSEGKASDGR